MTHTEPPSDRAGAPPEVSAVGAEFRALLERYYRSWFRFHPEAAVEAGVSGYGAMLAPFSEEQMGGLVCLNDELIVGLDELDRDALDADQRIDYALAYGAAALENQRLLEWEQRAPDPVRLLPVNAVYQLTIRPVEDFAAALMGRLNAIPAHLEGARDHLVPRARGIPPPWLRAATTEARQAVGFLASLPAHPKLVAAPIAGLDRAITNACGALVGFADFLEGTLAADARGEFACGRDYFEHLLARRHFIDVEIDELYAFGERLVAATRTELHSACAALTGSADLGVALARIRAAHPPADALLGAYRAHMQAARAFVAQRGLVTMPARERLDVVETPPFLRHQIPFAAYSEPSPNDPAQHGHYYVTPPVDAEQLAEHDEVGIMHTCVHEAWPGHHLQFVSANLSAAAATLPRLLNPAASFYEGWALYSEQLMQEEGFLDRPESRVVLLRDRLWRALRILIDIDIHTRAVSLETAADRLVQELGFARSQAIGELTWYSRAPTVPLGYATGWRLINALREQRRAAEPGWSLRAFHDRLLSAGSIALPLVIRRVFGEQAWDDVKAQAFG